MVTGTKIYERKLISLFIKRKQIKERYDKLIRRNKK